MVGLVHYFLIPSNLINVCLLLGITALFVSPIRRLSRWAFVLAGLIYFILGSGPVSTYLMKGLEFQYPRLGDAISNPDIHDIVVLAGYAESLEDMPVSARINSAAAYRLLEAVRIYQRAPETRQIWITGRQQVPAIMKQMLIEMGIPEADIHLDSASDDTLASAYAMARQLKDAPIYLVTSAGHMPRAMAAFEHTNLKPVPAPTHYLSRINILQFAYLPTPEHLQRSDRAIFEYLAGLRDAMLSPAQ